MERTLLSTDQAASIFLTAKGKILKVIQSDYAGVYPYYLFCTHCVNHPNILSPIQTTFENGQVEVLMEKGEKSFSVTDLKVFLREILDALVYLEGLDLIHGDIKPSNIVFYKGHYCLIDFDLLPHRKNNIQLTQSFADVYGYALRQKIRHPDYNNFHQALYALARTLEIFARTGKQFRYQELSKPVTIHVHGMPHVILVPERVKLIHDDPKTWIKMRFKEEGWKSFLLRLIGKDKFTSFAQARNDPLFGETITISPVLKPELLPLQVPKWTWLVTPITNSCSLVNLSSSTHLEVIAILRVFYDYACRENLSSLNLFCIYNAFYRYNYLVEKKKDLSSFCEACKYSHLCNYTNSFVKKILEIDQGRVITEYPESNYEARIFLEYLVPGSWCLTSNLDYPIQNLLEDVPFNDKFPRRVFLHGQACLFSKEDCLSLADSDDEYERVDSPSTDSDNH